LQNGPKVLNYPNVKGLETNMFFLDHTIAEDSVQDSTSKTNLFEAKFVLKLAEYLINTNGYQVSQITILTAYLGQMRLIQKLGQNPNLDINVVDNFQGAENDIVILSLVSVPTYW
jgi:superfamily I DNA and/or RNA helicase